VSRNARNGAGWPFQRLLLGALIAAVGSGLPGRAWAQQEKQPGEASQNDGPPLTIDEAVRLAESHHPQLASQKAAVDHALALKEQAVAGFLPGITGNFTFEPQTPNYSASPGFQRVLDARTDTGVDNVVDTTGNQVLVQCAPALVNGQVQRTICHSAPSYIPSPNYRLYQYWSSGIGLSWVLWDWGKTIHATRSGSALVTAERMGLRGSTLDVVLNAKLAYFDALAAEAEADVAEEEVKTRQRHLDTAEGFHSAGTNTRVDVAAAQSFLAQGELALVRARAAVTVARAALAAAIGEDTMRKYSLVAPSSEGAPLPSDGAISAAANERPEVLALAYRAQSADEAAKSARGAYLPQVVVQAGPWWSGPTMGQQVTNIGASVSIMYPGQYGMNPWLVQGNADEQQALADEFSADEHKMHNTVRLEAEQARAALVAARKAAAASAKYVTTARERRDEQEARYRQGVGTFLELTDSELQYTSARFEDIRSKFDIGRAQSQLARALAQQ